MRTQIIVVILMFIFIALIGMYKSKLDTIELIHSVPNYIETSIVEDVPSIENEALNLVNIVNQNIIKVNSISCNNVKIYITNSKVVPITLWSDLYYEKPKSFRMITSSRLCKESDVGSNINLFWFWSNRMNPPILYYANHSDLIKIPLRPTLNPLWIMECLGVQEISLKNVKIEKYQQYWAVYQSRVSTLGRLITKMTLIDPQYKRIVGHYLYNNANTLIASSEVIDFMTYESTYIPTKFKMCWQEENLVMTCQLLDMRVNEDIPNYIWNIPSNYVKKDMTTLSP